MTTDRDLLLRALEGALTDDEATALEQRLASEPDLRAEFSSLKAMTNVLTQSRATAFAPGFADRVMAKVEAPPQAHIYTLQPAVRWAIAASFVLAIAVGALLWNPTPAPVLLAEAGTDVVTWTAADGSTVLLHPSAKLYEVAHDSKNAQYQLEGEGFFAITHNPSRTVSVEAGEAIITVLGTRFGVRTDEAGTAVYLEEGRVALQSQPTNEQVILSPGEEAQVAAGGTLTPPEAAEATPFTNWLQVSFTSEPIQAAFTLIAQRFGLTLTADPEILTETLSGSFPLADTEQTLADLALVAGGRFEQTGPDSYRFIRE